MGFPPWGAATPGTLRLLAKLIPEGSRTLETGCGATTVLLAGLGCRHTSISPDPDEQHAVRDACRQLGVDTGGLELVLGTSDDVLPALPAEPPFDAAVIDGAHAFPHPVLDWWFAARRLRVGGTLVLDDVPIPAVGVVFRHLYGEDGWRLVDVADERTAVFEKRAGPPPGDPWVEQPFNRGYPDKRFLGLRRYVEARASRRWHEGKHDLARRLPQVRERLRRR